jgi:hypothetical protein
MEIFNYQFGCVKFATLLYGCFNLSKHLHYSTYYIEIGYISI